MLQNLMKKLNHFVNKTQLCEQITQTCEQVKALL